MAGGGGVSTEVPRTDADQRGACKHRAVLSARPRATPPQEEEEFECLVPWFTDDVEFERAWFECSSSLPAQGPTVGGGSGVSTHVPRKSRFPAQSPTEGGGSGVSTNVPRKSRSLVPSGGCGRGVAPIGGWTHTGHTALATAVAEARTTPLAAGLLAGGAQRRQATACITGREPSRCWT